MSDSSLESGLSDSVRRLHGAAQQALNARNYKQTHELCTLILRQSPRHADATFLLGMIAAEHSNFGKAAELIERAIALDSRQPEYYAQLGRCRIALHQPREAMQAAARALQFNPRGALVLDTIGVVLARVGDHVGALRAFQGAAAHEPTNAAYQYNLGAALQFAGDFVGARAAYEKVLAIEPGHYRAWSSLAQLAKEPFDQQMLRQLNEYSERALAGGVGQVDAALHYAHALAKHSEDAGEYARAFNYLDRGKRNKRSTLSYSSADDGELFDILANICTPEFLASKDVAVKALGLSNEPIFIVGMPRTGTTLVERILSSHPSVFAAGELTNLALVLKRAAATRSNLVLDAETLRAIKEVEWSGIGNDYVESTRPRTGHTPRFIDKMPLNFLYAGFIHRALPNAKIICLRRDPVDTCLSNYRQLFATQFPYYNYAYDLLDTGRYYVMFDALVARWRELMPQHFYEVQYESVVNDLEAEARKLMEFCELDWDPACLSFHENVAPVSTASSVQVRQPIYKTSVARWRKYEQETLSLRQYLKSAGIVGVI
ncbi:MAG: sulfotransferase [Candidatus Obscuribacterales bacterium]|nr:sulfotransferase [Steroidobacteraceae bacterium]